MKVEDVLKILQRFTLQNNVRCVDYLSDGDRSTYKPVFNAPIWKMLCNKLDCVRHVQKRMSTTQRILKAQK